MRPALLMLFTSALIPLRATADDWHKQWSVGTKPELRITAGDASVSVESGSERSIEATLTTRGISIGDSGVRVRGSQTGDRVEIEVRVPQTHFGFNMRSIRLEVRVPHSITGDIHTGDGSVKLRDLHGSIRADTGDGSIEADDLDGTLEARSGDGSMHVRGRFDNLQVHTQDGSVDIRALLGSRVQSEWRVQTGDGSVSVRIPPNLAANLELHTGDGSIHLDLPLTTSGTQNEHEMQGKLNGGGPPVVVRTGDGSISVGAS
jgi:DUF4097 and DUF4098 domain-containing protein YvlB